jgi:outer membrane lipoprotein-sorting protein
MLRTLGVRIVPVVILAALLICAGADLALAQETDNQEAVTQAVEEKSNDPLLEKAKSQYDDFRERAGETSVRAVLTTPFAAGTLTTTTVVYYKGEKSRVESVVESVGNQAAGAALTFNTPPSETVYIRDGKDVWLVTPGQAKKKLTDLESGYYVTEYDLWGLIPENAEVAGEEEIGGRDCHVVKVTLRAGEKPATLWLDKESLVIAGGEGPYNGSWMRWINSDFREVEGRQVPYKTEFFDKEESAGVMIVEAFEPDADISDDLFDPAGLLGEQERAMRALYETTE